MLVLAAATLVPAALAHRTAAPKLVGNPKAGKVLFNSACAACHTLEAAGSKGPIGPDLDKHPLPEAKLIKAMTYGGATVMTPIQRAHYTTKMPAFKRILNRTVIRNIAAFVYVSTHH
jgi:mono/diheme cytochrome c family protein